MTLLLNPPPAPHPCPIPPPEPPRPLPGPPPPSVWGTYPGQPVPTGPNPNDPPPRPSIHIGSPPSLPRRVRIARVCNQLGRYALAWGVVGLACYWLADVHMAAPCMAIAAMLANPWRPKRPARPVRRATRRAVQSRPWRICPRRSVTPTLRARAA